MTKDKENQTNETNETTSKSTSTGFNIRINKNQSEQVNQQEDKQQEDKKEKQEPIETFLEKRRQKLEQRKQYLENKQSKANKQNNKQGNFLERHKKALLIFSAFLTFALLAFTIYFVVQNHKINRINQARTTQLDIYESTLVWVADDLKSYLTVKDETSWENAKANSHMTDEYKQKLYGSSFNYANFYHFKSVSLTDAQYTFADKDADSTSFKLYVLATVIDENNKTKAINFIVFVQNNHIYNIVAY